MIDTDKSEGHTPVRKKGEWPRWCEDWLFSVYSDDYYHIPNWNQDNNLACDAPLLLAEVKRLRSIADDLYAYIVSDAGISLKIIEEQMDWRNEE